MAEGILTVDAGDGENDEATARRLQTATETARGRPAHEQPDPGAAAFGAVGGGGAAEAGRGGGGMAGGARGRDGGAS